MEFIYFLGRFHVLVLHLPIASLLVVILIEWLARKDKYRHLDSAAPFLWAAAALTAIGTVMLGYFHFSEGGFAGASANAHRLLGTGVAVLTTAAFLLRTRNIPVYRRVQLPVATVLLVLVTLTGHYGGNLTHGDTYLVEYAPGPLRRLAGLEAERPANPDPARTDPATADAAHADPALLERLGQSGFLARQVSQSDPRLVVNPAGAGASLSAEQVNSLTAAAQQVVSLSLSDAGLDDAAMATIGQLAGLAFLRLDNNHLTDQGLAPLKGLTSLQLLNLYGNGGITDAGVETLAELPALRKVYLWGTGVSPRGAARLKALRPEIQIDLGAAT